MKKPRIEIKDKEVFIRFVVYEILATIVLSAVHYLLLDIPFVLCLKRGAFYISLASLGTLGMQMIPYIIDSKWHLRRANEEYPVYTGIILIVLNAIICPLVMWQRERSYLILIVPIAAWLFQIMICIIHRWARH